MVVCGAGRKDTRKLWRSLLVGLALCLLAPGSPLAAQIEDAPERRVDLQELQTLREQVESNVNLEQSLRARILTLYDESIATLESVRQSESRISDYERERGRIGRMVEAIREELRQPRSEPDLGLPENASAERIEARLTRERTLVESNRAALRDVEQLSEERTARRNEISRRLGTLDQQIDAINDDMRSLSDTGTQADLARALRRNTLIRREAAQREIEALRAQMALLEARATLLPWQRDKAQRRLEESETIVEWLDELGHERRHEEARESLEEVRKLAADVTQRVPQLVETAEETERFAEMLWGEDGVIVKTEDQTRVLANARRVTTELDRISEMTRRRYEAVGSGGSVTQWWPKFPEDFPKLVDIRTGLRRIKGTIPEIQHQLILFEEIRGASRAEGERILASLQSASGASDEAAANEAAVFSLLQTRQNLLDSLIQQCGRYSDVMAELDTVGRNLLQDGEQVREFLYERLYWARSVPAPMLIPTTGDLLAAFLWLNSPANWEGAFRSEFEAMRAKPLVAGAVLLLFGLVLGSRGWMKRRLARLAKYVADPETDSFRHTLEALLYTVALAAPLPLVFYWLSRTLSDYETTMFIAASGRAFYFLSLLVGSTALVRQLLRPHGLAEVHFDWPSRVGRAIHKGLIWPQVVSLPFLYVALHLAAAGLGLDSPESLQAYSNSLGRMAFISAFLLLFFSLTSVFRPRSERGAKAGEGRRATFRRVSLIASPIIALITLVPAALAVTGFYISAFLVVYLFLRTLWLAILAVIGGALLFRWYETNRASRKRKLALAAASAVSATDQAIPKRTYFDIPVAEAQVRQLFRFVILVVMAVGLYSIWDGALPAMQVLKRVQLWPTVQVLEASESKLLMQVTASPSASPRVADAGSETADQSGEASAIIDPMGASSSRGGPSPDASVLTLWNIFQALLALIVTVALAKNVPGLLELILITRTRLDVGARVAFSTLIRYVIIIIGASVIFRLLGLNWDKVQWLAAALTFGLGFGLQEIVANFVSGLILLLERPIRVGDAVSIANLQGRVSRIQIRATTITLWDRSEMIVPNKEFVTTKLVNWTLSDSKRRIDIPVRVAYGANVREVKQALIGVAAAHENVLDDPPPTALLLEFGDDALKFELRFFTEFGHGLKTKDELSVAIDDAFRERGIDFALPQLNIQMPRRQTVLAPPVTPPPEPAK